MFQMLHWKIFRGELRILRVNMNLVLPISSPSKFFNIKDYFYPPPLIEVMGRPIIQHVVENITSNLLINKIIYIVRDDECEAYSLDSTLRLLSPVNSEIIKLRGDTRGALCSVLLAIDHINNSNALIIANADQIFQQPIADSVSKFTDSDFDAACLTFQSVHPRWSYIREDECGNVIETAEKRPISKNAIAGFYMYKKGSDFIRHGMSAIRRGPNFGDSFYVSPVFNEFILSGQSVGHFPIPNGSYFSFYSPQKIEEYEISIGSARS